MFRLLLFTILISLISLASARSEAWPILDVGFCLDSSTLIIKGRILDESGGIKIESVLKGKLNSRQIIIPELREINKYGDYSPDIIAGWEVIIFFKANQEHNYVPVFYWDNISRALGFGLSTLWFKDGKVFYAGMSPDDKVKFMSQGDQRDMESKIIEHIRIKEAIKRIEKHKSCRRKFKRLEKLYEESVYDEMIFDAMLQTKCGDQILAFVRPTVLDSLYTYMQKKMLPTFVEYGEQQIVTDLEMMFDKEFKFWKEYIGVSERQRWWHLDSGLEMRFAIFGTLLHLLIDKKLGDWEQHANEVITYFGSLEAYRTNTSHGKLHESVQIWLHY